MTDQGQQPDDNSGNDARQLTSAVQQLVESREQELEVKRAEIEVQGKEIESNERIALASIKAQSNYYKDHFTHYNAHLIHRYFFIGALVAVIALFSLGAIYLGASALVMDLFKLLVPLIVGLAGGYHWGARSANRQPQPQREPSPEDE